MGKVPPPIAIAWLSLDEGDNNLTRFLTYFNAALNRAAGTETTIGERALGMQSPALLDGLERLSAFLDDVSPRKRCGSPKTCCSVVNKLWITS